MNSSSSGKKLEGFFTGKGFYIVLFLCAAVIGVSAWMMAAGNGAMSEEPVMESVGTDSARVETIIVPGRSGRDRDAEIEAAPPQIRSEGLIEAMGQDEAPAVAESGAVSQIYIWPVTGELERGHSAEKLCYDVTMRDWRTHCGVDIAAPLGETVYAAHAGVVQSIVQDDLYGTVLTVEHGDGVRTVYANLAAQPAVNVGDWVEAGSIIGSVGDTALCEIGQGTHLHFAVEVDGIAADPLAYLPG